MTASLLFDIAVAALIPVIGAWVIFTRDVMTAVVAFIVYGLVLTLIWVRLSAIDVALTEAAVGGGLTGMLLLGAAARFRTSPSATASRPAVLGTAALCLLISAGLAWIVLDAPFTSSSLAPLAVEHLPQSGLGNAVAGVLFVYRALDTLLEKIVLLLALLGVWSVASDEAWLGGAGLRTSLQPDDTLELLAKCLPPIGLLFGIYMCWAGATQPGGAFQGGAVLAAMWLLLMIAGLRKTPAIHNPLLRLSLIAGPMLFLAIGLAGFVLADGFLVYPEQYAKALIVSIEIALTLSIAVTLGLLAAGPPEEGLQR